MIQVPDESGKIDRIFEPLYTSKAPSEVSGLWLPMVHGVVELMGRKNSGQNQSKVRGIFGSFSGTGGYGIEFEKPRQDEDTHGLHVLVVDDEEPNLSMLKRLLGQTKLLGFSVSTFPSGLDGVNRLQKKFT